MTPRERVLMTIAHKEPDRVPVGFDMRADVERMLLEHFGVKDRLSLYDALDVDGFSVFCDSYVYPDYQGPEPLALADGSRGDFFGVVCQRHQPLRFARSVADLEQYRWPSADWFGYSTVKRRCVEIKERNKRVTVGGEGGCGVFHAINLRGYEPALMDPLVDPEFTHAYMERMGDFFVEWNERWLSAAEGEFDIYRCGDDMGNCMSML